MNNKFNILDNGLFINKISKTYGKKQVVRDINISIKRNEIVGLLGPNGAGKTTTFYIIVGLVKPDSGSIILDKLDVKALHRAKINMFTKNDKLIEYNQHTDTDFKCKTFLISLNTCNGFTRIGKDKTIPSVENTGIFFPGDIFHNSTNCTDKNVRVNININYF